MYAIYRHAWMQKHPTPSTSGGDFHWHPTGVPDAIRATLTDLSSRSRGRPASVWIIDASYVAWARTFSAVSPSDRRKYTGLSVTIGRLEGESAPARWNALLPDVLEHMPVHPAAPFANQLLAAEIQLADQPDDIRPRPVDARMLQQLFDPTELDLAHAVVFGGQAFSHDSHHDDMPRLLGRLLSWLPLDERAQPRTGMFTENRAAVERTEHDRATHNFLHYLGGAWQCPAAIERQYPGYPRYAWHLICDLAASASLDLAAIFRQLTATASSWDSAEHLFSHLLQSGVLSQEDVATCDRLAPSPLMFEGIKDAGWLWNRLLHYWGRGFLSEVPASRLASLLARRIAADHLFYLDAPETPALPTRYLRRLQYEALLRKEHVATLDQALRQCIPSLSSRSEVQLG